MQSRKQVSSEPPGYAAEDERYTAGGKWLEEGTFPSTSGKPDIYVQGSFRLGAVVRPLRNGEEAGYDIDLACQLRSSVERLCSVGLLDAIRTFGAPVMAFATAVAWDQKPGLAA